MLSRLRDLTQHFKIYKREHNSPTYFVIYSEAAVNFA